MEFNEYSGGPKSDTEILRTNNDISDRDVMVEIVLPVRVHMFGKFVLNLQKELGDVQQLILKGKER